MAALIYIIEQSSQNRGHKLKVSTALFKRDKFLKNITIMAQFGTLNIILKNAKIFFYKN